MSKPVMSDLFTFRGRRNRKSYLLFLLAAIVIQIVVSGVSLRPAASPMAMPKVAKASPSAC